MRALIKKSWVPLLLFSIDVVYLGGGNIGFLASLGAAIVFFLKALVDLFKSEKEDFLEHISRSAVYALTLAAIICGILWNNSMGGRNAAAIVDALEKYKAANERYPDRLEELVPGFLPAVPPAKLCLSEYRKYIYGAMNDGHYLRYYTAPPYAMQIYHVEEKRWGFVD